MKVIGKRVLALRRQLGISQTQLAEKAGLANSTLCDIEKGRMTPSIKSLKKLADALGVPVADLLLDLDSASNEIAPTGTEGN